MSSGREGRGNWGNETEKGWGNTGTEGGREGG